MTLVEMIFATIGLALAFGVLIATIYLDIRHKRRMYKTTQNIINSAEQVEALSQELERLHKEQAVLKAQLRRANQSEEIKEMIEYAFLHQN